MKMPKGPSSESTLKSVERKGGSERPGAALVKGEPKKVFRQNESPRSERVTELAQPSERTPQQGEGC